MSTLIFLYTPFKMPTCLTPYSFFVIVDFYLKVDKLENKIDHNILFQKEQY